MSIPKLVSISAGNRAGVIAARNKRVEEHMYLVRPIAQAIARMLPPSFDVDDLIATGYMALMDAAIRYRPKAHGGTPFDAYARLIVRGRILDSINGGRYTEATRPLIDEQSIHLVVDNTLDESLDQARQCAKLEKAIAALTPNERKVIRLHYRQDRSLVEIARMLCVAPASAWRIHGRALRALRDLLELDPAA